MTVSFIKAGQKVLVEKVTEGERESFLAPAIYTIEQSRELGLYLEKIQDKYTLPEKLYGNVTKAAEKIMKTYDNRTTNLGVLLSGIKGTGKSLLVKALSNEALSRGIPVIQVNTAIPGEAIFNFIESIGECVMVFDEFAKNYSNYRGGSGQPTQVSLLSLLDGLTNSKRLHLFSENNVYEISEFLLDRPGRIHYHLRYSRLDNELIIEYCKDRNVPEEVIDKIVNVSRRIKTLSFDVLKCLVDEFILHGGEIDDLLGELNVSLLSSKSSNNPKVLSCKDKEGNIIPLEAVTLQTTPGRNEISVEIDLPSDKDDYNKPSPVFGRSKSTKYSRLALVNLESVNGNIYTFRLANIEDLVLEVSLPIGFQLNEE